ncbi:hypothetical protein [Streptomyces sp. NPDC047981]|uniref:hypothetical protein n=1 Tax=Streptomyces sp. NPDC047981 TaxID=3154610 RepID=UPI00344202E0
MARDKDGRILKRSRASQETLQKRHNYHILPDPQTQEDVVEILERLALGIQFTLIPKPRNELEEEFWSGLKSKQLDRVLKTFPYLKEALDVFFANEYSDDFSVRKSYIMQMARFVWDDRTAGAEQMEKLYPGHRFLMAVEEDRSRNVPYSGGAAALWSKLTEQESDALVRSSPQVHAWTVGLRAFQMSGALADQAALENHVLNCNVSDIVILSSDAHIMNAVSKWGRDVAAIVGMCVTDLEGFYDEYERLEEGIQNNLRGAHEFIDECVRRMHVEPSGEGAEEWDYFEKDRANGTLVTGEFAAYWESLNGQHNGVLELSDREVLMSNSPQIKEWVEHKKVWDLVLRASNAFQDKEALLRLIAAATVSDLERMREIPELVTALGEMAMMLEGIYQCETDPRIFSENLETAAEDSFRFWAWLLTEPRIAAPVIRQDAKDRKPYNGGFGTFWDKLTYDQRSALVEVPETYSWAVGKSAWAVSNGFEDKKALFEHLAAAPVEDTVLLEHNQATLLLMGDDAIHLIQCISGCRTDPAAFYREFQHYDAALQARLRTCPVIHNAIDEMSSLDID